MKGLILTILGLLMTAMAARLLAKRIAASSGLPAGRLLYSDTGYAVGALATMSTDAYGQKVERPLISTPSEVLMFRWASHWPRGSPEIGRN